MGHKGVFYVCHYIPRCIPIPFVSFLLYERPEEARSCIAMSQCSRHRWDFNVFIIIRLPVNVTLLLSVATKGFAKDFFLFYAKRYDLVNVPVGNGGFLFSDEICILLIKMGVYQSWRELSNGRRVLI